MTSLLNPPNPYSSLMAPWDSDFFLNGDYLTIIIYNLIAPGIFDSSLFPDFNGPQGLF